MGRIRVLVVDGHRIFAEAPAAGPDVDVEGEQVLRCLVAGLGRDRLYLSPHTVRTHMQNVLGRLGVHSTLAAVASARRAGVGPAEAVPVGG